MKEKEINYAFIDSQNTYFGIKSLGWKIDWNKFRVYLREKYNVINAFIFIGYISSNNKLYEELQKAGFMLIFKTTIFDSKGKIKGNCDADMVLKCILEIQNFNKAIIVTSDGDFYSLVKYLYQKNKLKVVLNSHVKNCSSLLKIEAKERIRYFNIIKNKVSK